MSDVKFTTNEIENSEHIDKLSTGDNVSGKKVANYGWDGNNWHRTNTGLFNNPYDEIAFSNPDANGNYQTITSKLSGTTQNVLSLTFDGSNNVTDVARTT